ncbi:MAG: preprotein translocase subunit SecG [Terricaulis sp.]
MTYVVLGIHLFICVGLIGLVLLQRSEGGALGMGGSGGGALMTGRGAADALARMTSFAGAFFLVTSLLLTVLSGAAQSNAQRSVFDLLPSTTSAPAIPEPVVPAPTRPDPTESAIPSDTQLASAAAPAPGISVAPAPAAASTRAGPVVAAPAPARTTTTTNPPARTTPASTTPRQPAATTTRAPAPVTQPAPAPRQPVTAPTTPGAIDIPAAQLAPESGDAVTNVDDPVRRERAGPDQ